MEATLGLSHFPERLDIAVAGLKAPWCTAVAMAAAAGPNSATYIYIYIIIYIYIYRHTTESELSSQRYRSLRLRRLRRLRRLWRLWPIDCHEDRGEKHPDPEPVKTVKRSGRGQEEVRKCEMFMKSMLKGVKMKSMKSMLEKLGKCLKCMHQCL